MAKARRGGDDAWKQSAALLSQLDIDRDPVFRRSLTSAVTTSWGVQWDEEMISRDLIQNFYDANQPADITIDVERGSDVTISAPTAFNLEHLFYLGSDKDEDAVGEHGEGFKAAATCLLRDHDVTPVATANDEAVVLRVAERPIDGSDMYPVIYDFFGISQPFGGTRLMLPRCKKKLVRAVADGLTHFLHDENPLLGTHLWSDYSDNYRLYKSSRDDGYVFYQKLRRGTMVGIPLVLVIKKEYQRIEKKVANDRDRKAFGDEIMQLFYNQFAKSNIVLNRDAIKSILVASRHVWQSGHPLLSELAKTTRGFGSYNPLLAELFADRFFARSERGSVEEQLQFEKIEQQWKHEGRVALPGYFVHFGVISAREHIREIHEQARAEVHSRESRSPTDKERACLAFLGEILTELDPALAALFSKERTNYTVAMTEVVLGELKEKRSYRSRDVFFSDSVFVAEFASALATHLHEHAHIFGFDGSRGFSDALTELIEVVVRHRNAFDEYECRWQELTAMVVEERGEQESEATNEERVREELACLDLAGLRDLVNRISLVELRRALQVSEHDRQGTDVGRKRKRLK